MKHSRVKQKKPIPLGQILEGLMKLHRRFASQDMMRICEKWEAVVGKTIAAHAQPALLKNQRLVVHTRSSSWIHQLSFSKAEIIANLNIALNNTVIHDIRFRIGPVDVPSGLDDSKRIE